MTVYIKPQCQIIATGSNQYKNTRLSRCSEYLNFYKRCSSKRLAQLLIAHPLSRKSLNNKGTLPQILSRHIVQNRYSIVLILVTLFLPSQSQLLMKQFMILLNQLMSPICLYFLLVIDRKRRECAPSINDAKQ